MKIRKITNLLLKEYPLSAQEEWDESGFLNKGNLDANASEIYVCLDLTNKVVDEAIKNKVNLIISHHPIFQGNLDHPILNKYKQIINKVKKAKITVLSLHTCFDLADSGMNFVIAHRLKLDKVKWYKNNKKNGFVEGVLKKELNALAIANMFKKTFNLDLITTNADSKDKFKKLVICSGAGLSLFEPKYQELANANALVITGDIKHHGWQDLNEYHLKAMDVGHVLENAFVDFIPAFLNHEFGDEVKCFAIATKRKEHTI